MAESAIDAKKQNHFAKFCPNRTITKIDNEIDNQPDNGHSDGTITVTNLEGNDNKQSIENPNVTEQPTQNLNDIETEGSHTLYIANKNANYSDWSMDLNTNSHRILFKIDSGALCNVLSKREYIDMSPRPKIKPTNVKLTAYSGTDIPILEKCVAHVKYKNKRTVLALFIVADTKSTPIIGLRTSEN